jgi:hypothetical protein
MCPPRLGLSSRLALLAAAFLVRSGALGKTVTKFIGGQNCGVTQEIRHLDFRNRAVPPSPADLDGLSCAWLVTYDWQQYDPLRERAAPHMYV